MNKLMTIATMKQFKEKDFTTKDIRRLTDKRHDNIMRDMDTIVNELISYNSDLSIKDFYKQSTIKADCDTRASKTYVLTELGFEHMLSSYSAKYRHMLIMENRRLRKENLKLRNDKLELIEVRDSEKIDRKRFTDCIALLKEYADTYRIKHENIKHIQKR